MANGAPPSTRRTFLAGAAGALASTALASGCRKHRDAITFGLYAALTGSMADFGTASRNGVTLAAEEINAAGGLLGKPLYIAIEDTRGDSAEAASAVTRLIHIEGAVGILGEVASSLSLAGGRICQRYRVPMVSPSSTNPAVTALGDCVFRVCFIDPFQGDVMARFARNTLGFSRVAIFKEQGSAYAVGLADAFRRAFLRLGGTIPTEQAYRSGDTHFSAQLGTILAQNPEGIFCPGYYTEAALIAREARGQGFRGRFMGGDGWSSPSLVQNDDNQLVGDFYSVGFAPDGASTEVARRFARNFEAKFHYAPNDLAALAYDATLAMSQAVTRAGAAVPERIRAELARTRNLDGATGLISLNEHRDAVKSAVILEVHENSADYRTTVNP
ncbi:MAG: ABC transporter substrate-binding protein [Deltaproteobacteria bacterium]|nr:ABC transporter substrate-binding protein [Deltaproteobacteria bacterium]MBK7067098.1 ABC transporter substrate-binding protein [Deltaproteobacteria bacterium]MBK8695681.1 ABC transporter substrate-binding protein [Deltaproteobacteria bacterium]MBP6833892.1 ABC transporter substrate-binding protein [Deltaproteobacteria bacterium]